MIPKHRTWLTALAVVIAMSTLLIPVSAQQKYRTTEEIWGAKFGYTSYKFRVRADKASGLVGLRRWNQIAIDASGLDHTPPAPGEDRAFGEQLGPCRASRAIAIVQIAVFEALNAVVKKYDSLVGMYPASKKTNRDVAIAQAAHDTLVVLFPSQKGLFDMKLNEDLAAAPNNVKKADAILVGRTAALAALGLCYNDGSKHAEQLMNTEYIPSDQPGFWRQDPISLIPLALGSQWNTVRPLVLESADQFRLPPPPAIDSVEYATAYNEAKRLGGDGIVTPTERTEEQTHIGTFWAYDGTPSLCAPPRLYNQIAMQIADQRATNDIDTARMLAVVNLALAEAAIAAWDSKFYYNYWRPVTAIREADAGTGPSGLGDNNPATEGDPTFTPLGAPASNLSGPNFTPPFPAYPSGHASFGGALFQTLRKIYGTDNIAFTFVSDELNGETRDSEGNVRPLLPRSFTSLSHAELENAQSRVYLGIHWWFDEAGGITLGNNVANYVYDRVFQPVR